MSSCTFIHIPHKLFKVFLGIINKFYYVGFMIPGNSFGLLFKYFLPSCFYDGRYDREPGEIVTLYISDSVLNEIRLSYT